MAFSHTRESIHENGAGASTTCAVTLASVIARGSLAVVSVGWTGSNGAGDVDPSIADDKGNSYTLIDRVYHTTGGYYWQTAYRDNITNSPITITATMGGGSRPFLAIIVSEWIGGLGGSSLNGHAINTQTNPGTSANAVTSTNFTPTEDNSLIVGSSVQINSQGTISAGTGYTLRLNNSDSSFDIEDKTLAVAAATAATFTTSASSSAYLFSTAGLAIKPGLLFNNVRQTGQAVNRAAYW